MPVTRVWLVCVSNTHVLSCLAWLARARHLAASRTCAHKFDGGWARCQRVCAPREIPQCCYGPMDA
jgi:hypothetical protein